MKTRTNQPVFDDAGNLVTDGYLDEKIKTQPKLLNSIVDNQGNPRFIEGDIEIEEIEGITQTYGKWSLSGTHLMIVVAYTLADATAISANTVIANVSSLPKWIYDKIALLFADRVANIAFNLYNDVDGSVQTQTLSLRKTNNVLSLYSNAITLTKERNGRIQFDLLIDTEAPEQEGE